MIRPEKYQFNWKPKTKSKKDFLLVKNLNELLRTLDLNKTELTRLALSDFVKYDYKPDKIKSRDKLNFEL